MSYAVETNSLCKHYRRVEAVRDLNLRIAEGSVYALMGPNGAGKTTLIKMLMNLVRPSAGQARMLGHAATALRGAKLESIGYVSENQKMPEWMSVGDFLAYWRPFYPAWDRTLEEQMVRRFELPLKQRLRHLSRGMRMKAALTSALAFRPRLVVLDEPLSGLDPLVRDDLMESLLAHARQTTVLISSHDLAEIDSFSSHVGYMDGGQLRLSAPIEEVRRSFCRVTVQAAAPLSAPAALPPAWLNFSCEGRLAQWVETAYEAEASQARAREVFGTAEVLTTPLTLREVFLTLARSTRPKVADAMVSPSPGAAAPETEPKEIQNEGGAQ